MIRLHAVGGLCNRLRAILGYRARFGRPLSVVWTPDEYVSHGRFSDVFEALDGVTFCDDGPWTVEDFSPPASVPADWERGYGDLVTKEDHIGPLTSYLAIHVRRTDHVPDTATHGGRIRPLEDYVEWAARWPTLPVYVATDNGQTQAKLCSMLGSRAVVGTRLDGVEIQALHDHRRNGTLRDAVRDLCRCSAATHFLGSLEGSYSQTINIFRRGRGLEPG